MRNLTPLRLALASALLLAVTHAQPTAVTEAEAREVAESWELAVGEGDGPKLLSILDIDGIIARALEGLDPPEGFADGMRQGFQQKLVSMLAGASEGGYYTLLNMRTEGGVRRAIFRLDTPDGLNYHDVKIERGEGGRLRFTDIYIALSGETLGAAMRRVALPLIAEQNRSIFSKLIGGEGEWMKALPDFIALGQHAQNGEHAEAVAAFDRLPDSVRGEKAVLLLAMMSLLHADEARYAKTIDAYLEEFPDDPSVAMVSIDGHFLRGDYDAALEAIDHVDASVGGDPYLNLLRGNVYFVQGKHDQARTLLRELIDHDPARPEAYFLLADIALADKRWAEMAQLLEALEARAGQDMSAIATTPDFAEFMASDPGKAWAAARGQPQP